MPLPNFVILGPPRTATTWLFTALSQHPQIGLSNLKELRFFDEHFERGESWYREQFSSVGSDAKAIGDITPGYFNHPDAPQRILSVLGDDVDLFVVNRDPVERAFSEYRGMLRRGETANSFSKCMADGGRLVDNSMYARQVRRLLQTFDPSRFHVLEFDQISSAPEKALAQIARVLDLDQPFPAAPPSAINQGTAPPRFRHVRQALSGVRSMIERRRLGRDLMWSIRRAGLIGRFHRLTSRQSASSTATFVRGEPEHTEILRVFEQDQTEWRKLRSTLLSNADAR